MYRQNFCPSDNLQDVHKNRTNNNKQYNQKQKYFLDSQGLNLKDKLYHTLNSAFQFMLWLISKVRFMFITHLSASY